MLCRVVGRFKNPGVPEVCNVMGNQYLLVELGINDLPKSGGSKAPPAHPGITPLHCNAVQCKNREISGKNWDNST